MRISSMLLLSAGILAAGGIGRISLKAIGIDRKHALFFLFCVFAVNSISAELTDDISFSAACLMIPIWLFGHLYNSSSIIKQKWIVLPLSAAAGAVSCFFPKHIFMIVLVEETAAALLLDAGFSMAFCGLTPVFAYASAYFYSLIRSGYGTMDLTEECLTAQLIGIMLTNLIYIVKGCSARRTARTYE